MRYLLDSHTMLWFVSNSDKLSSEAKDLITSPDSELIISISSIWEISIKYGLGKLEIKGGYDSLEDVIVLNKIDIMPIEFEHTRKQAVLPHYHKDPFDRMIISQAICEEIDVISIDSQFDKYFEGERVKRIW